MRADTAMINKKISTMVIFHRGGGKSCNQFVFNEIQHVPSVIMPYDEIRHKTEETM